MNEKETNKASLQPKVINFSAQKQGGSFFRKKAFIFGLIFTAIIAITTVAVGYFWIQQRTTTAPQAAGIVNPVECKDKVTLTIDETSSDKPNAKAAFLKGKVVNKCNKDVTLFMARFWCKNTKLPVPTCSDNRVSPDLTLLVPKKTTKAFSVRQQIGNTGECGSAQVDVFFAKKEDKSKWPQAGAWAYSMTACKKEQPVCMNINKVVAEKKVTVSMNFSYNKNVIEKFRFDWGDGTESFVSAQAEPPETATHTYLADGTYQIKGFGLTPAADPPVQSIGSDSCITPVSFTSTPTRYTCSTGNTCEEVECTAGQTCTSSCDPTKTNPCGSKYFDCDSNEACVQKDCPAGQTCQNKCDTTDQNACKTETKYHVCNSQKACEEKTCPIGQNCTSTCDPSAANPCGSTYSECVGNSCTSKSCPAGKTCSSTCDPAKIDSCRIFTHFVCERSACVERNCSQRGVSCATNRDCLSDSDCVVTPTVRTYQHLVCLNQACVKVDCSPNTSPCGNECTANSNCQTPVVVAKHNACRNNSCVSVTGEGTDTCASDIDCKPAATPPPIPPTGSVTLTIGAMAIGVAILVLGALLVL